MFNWLIKLMPYENKLLVVFLVSLIVLLAAVLIYFMATTLILPLLEKIAKRSKTKLDDELINHKIFTKLFKVIPFLFIYYAVNVIPYIDDSIKSSLQKITVIAIIVLALRLIFAFIAIVNAIYTEFGYSKGRPIKGYLQLLKIFLTIIAGICIISLLLDQSPTGLLTGIGGLTAVLLLIFKDTILSLVASIQISSNNMLQVGDWIEMPAFGADGDVIDIALHTVKVQNWDKTIVTIPTSKLVDSSFKNWRGMTESGGRRIKRSINIDVNTIRFLTEDEVTKFNSFELLKDYMIAKRDDLEKENLDKEGFNKRMLTNIGTFRAYTVNYLKAHPNIHDNMTFLVRQLEPTSEGLPLQIYVFVNDIAWANYEGIQSDIFDHLFSIIPEFGLRIFQKASGNDFMQLNKS